MREFHSMWTSLSATAEKGEKIKSRSHVRCERRECEHEEIFKSSLYSKMELKQDLPFHRFFMKE